MTFFFSFPFLASSSCLVFSCFSCLFFSCLSFFVFSLPCLLFPFLYLLFFLCFFFSLRLSCVCIVIGTMCNIYVVVFLGGQAVQSVFPGASNETYAPVWTWHIVGCLSVSFLYVSGGGMNSVSCDICVYHLWCICAFSLGYSSAPE